MGISYHIRTINEIPCGSSIWWRTVNTIERHAVEWRMVVVIKWFKSSRRLPNNKSVDRVYWGGSFSIGNYLCFNAAFSQPRYKCCRWSILIKCTTINVCRVGNQPTTGRLPFHRVPRDLMGYKNTSLINLIPVLRNLKHVGLNGRFIGFIIIIRPLSLTLP